MSDKVASPPEAVGRPCVKCSEPYYHASGCENNEDGTSGVRSPVLDSERETGEPAPLCVNHCEHDPKWMMAGECQHINRTWKGYFEDSGSHEARCGHRCEFAPAGEVVAETHPFEATAFDGKTCGRMLYADGGARSCGELPNASIHESPIVQPSKCNCGATRHLRQDGTHDQRCPLYEDEVVQSIATGPTEGERRFGAIVLTLLQQHYDDARELALITEVKFDTEGPFVTTASRVPDATQPDQIAEAEAWDKSGLTERLFRSGMEEAARVLMREAEKYDQANVSESEKRQTLLRGARLVEESVSLQIPDDAKGDAEDLNRDFAIHLGKRLQIVALAARKLVRRLREIHADGEYKAVWEAAQLQRGPYSGPNYEAELKEVEFTLENSLAPQPDPVAESPWDKAIAMLDAHRNHGEYRHQDSCFDELRRQFEAARAGS